MDKVAFLFSGQGSQYPGMMKDLYESSLQSRQIFDIADEVLKRKISKLCFEGTQEELNLTHNTQPCVLTADLAAYKAILSCGIKPDYVAGFSLGEYAALTASKVLNEEDVFTLIQLRADAMQEAVPVGKGAMAAIMKASEDKIIEICKKAKGYVEPVNFNCPGQVVVSGETDAVVSAINLFKEERIRAIMLPVSAPFHSKLMKPAFDKMKLAFENVCFSNAEFPIFLNVDANAEMDSKIIKQKVLMQTMSPVYWERTLKNMYDKGVRTFIECGPGKTLTGFVKKTILDEVRLININSVESLKEIEML